MEPTPHHLREINKSRIVAAVLAELDASQSVMTARCVDSNEIFSKTLQCSFAVPFTDSVIQCDVENDSVRSLDCSCFVAGQRLAFQLNRISASQWRLPQSIQLADFRSSERSSFAPRQYSAELVTARGACYGFAVDINSSCLCVEVGAQHIINEGDDVIVILRKVNTNCDVFYRSCRLISKTLGRDGRVRFILDLSPSRPRDSKISRLHERTTVTDVSVTLGGLPFVDVSEDYTFSIQNVSSGGMEISLRSAGDGLAIIPGLILQGRRPESRFLVVWASAGTYGLKVLVETPAQSVRWHQYLDQIAPREVQASILNRRELALKWTEGALSRGESSATIGFQLTDHLIADSRQDSPLILRRYVTERESDLTDVNFAFKRISEGMWLWDESYTLGDGEWSVAYSRTLSQCLLDLRTSAIQSSLMPRYVMAVSHDTVRRPGDEFFESAKMTPVVRWHAVQCSISAWMDRHQVSGAHTLQSLSQLSSKMRRSVMVQFSSVLFEGFSGVNGTHPILNGVFGKMGPHHGVQTKVVFADENVAAIVHRVVTHHVWSATGLTNGVFVLIPPGISMSTFSEMLAAIAVDEIAFGTDEFFIVFDGDSDECSLFAEILPQSMRCSVAIHDLLGNGERRYC